MDSLLLILSDNSPLQTIDDLPYIDPHIFFKHELNMLLSSRIRFKYIEQIPLLNTSVLNYGINEPPSPTTDPIQRTADLKEQIELAIHRFEPRLMQVFINIYKSTLVATTFNIEAKYKTKSLHLMFTWNHCQGRGYFHE